MNTSLRLPTLPLLRLTPFALLGTLLLPGAHAQSWNVTATAANAWNIDTNWTPNTFPNAIDAAAVLTADLVPTPATLILNLNAPITIGSMVVGDSVAATNGFYNIFNGAGGNLTFDVTAGNAKVSRTPVGAGFAGSTDNISATVILNDTLEADIRAGALAILGRITGEGGLYRSAGVSTPLLDNTTAGTVAAGGTLTLDQGNQAPNSYLGETKLQHGILNAVLRGDVLVGFDSVLGNSPSPITVGTATTPNLGSTVTLRLTAGSDDLNYLFERGIDFSQAPGPASNARVSLDIPGNGAGSPNTNRLTLTGPVSLGARALLVQVQRAGMTLDIQGDITGTAVGGGDSIRWNGFPPTANATDGRGGGTIRFSNLARAYPTGQGLICGTSIIDGVVGAVGTASPVGTQTIGLSTGSGGNIFGAGNFAGAVPGVNDTSPDTIRSIYLETPDSSFARLLTPGNGSITTPTTGGYGSVSAINGFRLGGLNTSGTVTFSGAIVPGNPTVGASTSNPATVAVNLALIAATGGTVKFTGGIADGTTIANTVTRVTVNQFRNHPNLDGFNNDTGLTGTSNLVGSDGKADPIADQVVGAPTGGTVVLEGINTWEGTTEVLGGTVEVNGSMRGNTLTIATDAVLAGAGVIDLSTANANVILKAGAALDPGTVSLPGQELRFVLGTGNLSLSAATAGAGSLRFEIGAVSDRVVIDTGVLDIGAGMDLADFAFTNTGGLPAGDYVLFDTNAAIVGTLGTTLTGTLFGSSVTLAKSADGQDIILTVGGGAPTALQTWRQTFFGVTTSTGTAANDFDADKDGVANLVEYLLGTIPTNAASVGNLINPARAGTVFTAEYNRKISTLTEVEVIPETSPSLAAGTWTPVGVTESQVSTAAGFELMRITATSANPRQFFRLRVREK